MKILLSIKPEFVEGIISGRKKYEFRKQLFKHIEIKTIVVYASSPICKIVGEFEIEDILSYTPSELWAKTGDEAGITSAFFFSYFANKTIAHAIKIGKFTQYPQPLCLEEYNSNLRPPQSFCYIDK